MSKSFEVTVSAYDANDNLVPYAVGTSRYSVVATATTAFTLRGGENECTAANAPTYGYTSAALTQFMRDGSVKFQLTPATEGMLRVARNWVYRRTF